MASTTPSTGSGPSAATKAYRQTQVLTAPPEHLQLMLYDGALRWCHQARQALVANDRETACAALERARRIVLYLIEGLRPEIAPELCGLMASAYKFVFNRLVDAALNGTVAAVEEAVGVLSELRAGWAELLATRAAGAPVTTPSEGAQPPPPAPAAHPQTHQRIRLTG